MLGVGRGGTGHSRRSWWVEGTAVQQLGSWVVVREREDEMKGASDATDK
jgi:hypothetical protein